MQQMVQKSKHTTEWAENLSLSSPNTDQFSKFFNWRNLLKILQ